MLNVYIVHVYSDRLAHVDNIKLVNPDKIICFANEEHEVDGIFKDFIDQLYPWLVENNKTIDIIAPGFERRINDRVLVHRSYGYYLISRKLIDNNTNVDFDNIHHRADKLYTMYCNRGSTERMKIVDTLAREKMLDQGIVTFRGVYFDPEFNTKWEYHDGSPLIDEEDYVLLTNTKPEYEPAAFPRSFFRGFVDIVCESRVDDLEFFPTEKTAKSIVGLKPFLALSCQHYHKYLQEEYGTEPYTEIFDYSFDSYSDINDRIEAIVANVKRLSTMDKNTVHDLVFDKMVRNKHRFEQYIHDHEKMAPRVLQFVNDTPFMLHGDEFAMQSWIILGRQYGWVK